MIYIGVNGNLKPHLLAKFHSSGIGEHSGQQATYKRLKQIFTWPNMLDDVQQWDKECQVCQQVKTENVVSPGLLQPLQIPTQVWSGIAMDFIEGLPRFEGKDIIMVVIDRLTKSCHFIPLCHPFIAQVVAQQFFTHVYKLHGCPSSIVSDRDKIFLCTFWKELFKIIGTKLCCSSAYHPQSDGQSERLNRCLE